MEKRYSTGFFLVMVAVGIFTSCDRSLNRFQEKQQVTEAEKKSMDRVIAIDDSIGKIRNKECRTLSLSQTITNYTEKMKQINMEGCPKEFSKSFDQHITSWNNLLQVTDKYPQLRGEMHDLFQKLEKSQDSAVFKKLKNDVWDTWDLIEVTTK